MLKPTTSDLAPQTSENKASAAASDPKCRQSAPIDAQTRRVAAPAVSSPVAMAGVDAFGRVTNWNLFSTTARHERQAHQIDRANRAQQSDLTQQQAELAAQAARAQSAYHTGGLERVRAYHNAVGTVAQAVEAKQVAQKSPKKKASGGQQTGM